MSEHVPAIARLLTGNRHWSESELAELQARVLQRTTAKRRALLDGALSATQVAKLLDISCQSVAARVDGETLLATLDQGELHFPRWQFDTNEPDGVAPGLVATLHALDVSALEKMSWLTRANPMLDDSTPLDLLKAGEIERVIALARSVGAR